MPKIATLLFAIAAYLVFLPTFLYLIAFVGNLQATSLAEAVPALAWLVPHSVSFGRDTGPVPAATAINLGLIVLFGLQHSVMARSGFKQWLKRTVPASVERSVYVLISSLALILLFWQWRPLGPAIWSVESGLGQTLIWTLFGTGFGLTLLSTLLIDHFELFGLRQAWSRFRDRPLETIGFVTPLFYRVVRHPLYLGFLMAFWATPYMTMGHLLFAAGMSAYIVVGTHLEERDLVATFGDDYRQYRRQVPQLVPVPGRAYRDGNPDTDQATSS